MHGKVIKSTGSWYVVRTDDGRIVECKVKGNFRLRGIRSTNPVAVGDGVTIKEQQTEGKEENAAFITEIDERRNYIIRKASNLSKQSHILAANVDMALLVVTIARPETSTTFIDRFLASAEAYRVPVCSTCSYRMRMYVRLKYRMRTARVCTPLPLANSLNCLTTKVL